jgi:hypothetical protein
MIKIATILFIYLSLSERSLALSQIECGALRQASTEPVKTDFLSVLQLQTSALNCIKRAIAAAWL